MYKFLIMLPVSCVRVHSYVTTRKKKISYDFVPSAQISKNVGVTLKF